MEHPLERLLIYTDRDNIEEFDIPEAEFDELYELFVTTKGDILDNRHTSVDFFNEVFYYLTCIFANKDSAEHLDYYLTGESSLYPSLPAHNNPQTKHELREAQEYAAMAVDTNYYVMGFVWLILKKLKKIPKHVRFFLIALEYNLENDASSDFITFRTFYDAHSEKYDNSFHAKPWFTFDLLGRDADEWESATSDFDREEIKHIVHRFAGSEDKRVIVEEIIQALDIANGNPNCSRKVSMITYGRKADEPFLKSLLVEEAAQTATLEETNDTTVRKGFEAYIIKNHKRVLDILMLVANMGKSQMPLLIKFIKAFQRLGYIKPDCFNQYDQFLKYATEQFSNVCFDKANVKRNIEMGTKRQDEDYEEAIQKIANYLTPLL